MQGGSYQPSSEPAPYSYPSGAYNNQQQQPPQGQPSSLPPHPGAYTGPPPMNNGGGAYSDRPPPPPGFGIDPGQGGPPAQGQFHGEQAHERGGFNSE